MRIELTGDAEAMIQQWMAARSYPSAEMAIESLLRETLTRHMGDRGTDDVRTPLGQLLRRTRREFMDAGGALLSDDEVHAEAKTRRGDAVASWPS